MSSQTLTPEVLWAQRSSASDVEKNHILLTLMAPDVPADKMKLDLQPTKLAFAGPSTSKKVAFNVELEFYGEILPAKAKISHTDRDIELVLPKKELQADYWPRLLKESRKMHFLRTDFDKWVDEDEQDGVVDDADYMGNNNMMGGMGGGDGFPGIDFSKIGGAQGSGGLPDMGDLGSGSEDDDDGDMPALEGAEDDQQHPADSKPTQTSSATSSKIAEVE